MKKSLITMLLFLLFIAGYSQNLSYEIHGKYSHPVKKDKLDKANFMNEIIPYYPANWIMSYVSVEILTTSDGVEMMVASNNDTLSTEQKNILNKADLGTDIVININYKYKNPVTDNIDDGRMNYTATIVPETEAEYPGGHQQMTQYLEENAINKISETTSKQMQTVKVGFTVNEKGEIANAQISGTSGDPATDQLLLDAINRMPKWRPAEDASGIKVKQEFELSVSGVNEGC